MRMLAHEALCCADGVYGVIERLNALSLEGRQSEVIVGLAMLADVVAGNRPVLRGVIWAQEQAAQALNLPQRPMRVLCAIGVRPTQPHPDAANSHVSPPEQPTPSVA